MQRSEYRVHIIGAGVSGLVAASVLEARGYYPVLIEATDRVGGRLKTDESDGYFLDHGFQVLLTAYPLTRKYLELDLLDLRYYKPGAAIYENGRQGELGDPLRDLSFLWPTLLSSQATIRDKWLILKLNRELASLTPEEIFEARDGETHEFLRDYGFSEKIIRSFLRPFFSGIFLEPNLETSSHMFRFVFKMFGEGRAAVPASGIEAIPRQLLGRLEKSSLKYQSRVKEVKEGQITLDSGKALPSHATIIAAEAYGLVGQMSGDQEWKSCDNLYFEVEDTRTVKPIISLLAGDNHLVNNLCFPTALTNPERNTHLLSVTIVKEHGLGEAALMGKVKEELKTHFGIHEARFLRRFRIPRALPRVSRPRYALDPTETRLTDSIFLAGDLLTNGSLNAAMLNGERAAVALADYLDAQ